MATQMGPHWAVHSLQHSIPRGSGHTDPNSAQQGAELPLKQSWVSKFPSLANIG